MLAVKLVWIGRRRMMLPVHPVMHVTPAHQSTGVSAQRNAKMTDTGEPRIN